MHWDRDPKPSIPYEKLHYFCRNDLPFSLIIYISENLSHSLYPTYTGKSQIFVYLVHTMHVIVAERERKHFPKLSNRQSVPTYRARGRRYIPHGYGDDYEFIPHPEHIEPAYTE